MAIATRWSRLRLRLGNFGFRLGHRDTLEPRDDLKIIINLCTIHAHMAGLYKGFAPKVLRMGIGGGVSILAFELAVPSAAPS